MTNVQMSCQLEHILSYYARVYFIDKSFDVHHVYIYICHNHLNLPHVSVVYTEYT